VTRRTATWPTGRATPSAGRTASRCAGPHTSAATRAPSDVVVVVIEIRHDWITINVIKVQYDWVTIIVSISVLILFVLTVVVASPVQIKYYRLNGDCARCPTNLLFIAISLAVTVVVLGGLFYYLRKKKVSLALLSIGVDYLQASTQHDSA
jgi:uncharacterized integral membrane protein